MPEMQGEKSGATHHGFSGKDFEKELTRLERKFQMSKFKSKEVKDVFKKGADPLLQQEREY